MTSELLLGIAAIVTAAAGLIKAFQSGKEVKDLVTRIETLERENKELRAEVDKLQHENDELREQNQVINAVNAELRRLLDGKVAKK